MIEKLRWAVLTGTGALVLLAGWWTLLAVVLGAAALGFVCLAVDSSKAEKVWLWMVLALVAAMLINVAPARHGCDEDSPAGCAVRAY